MPNKVKIRGGPSFSWYVVTAALFIWDFYYGLAWLITNLVTVVSIYTYLRYRHVPIIKSLLDTDWYKFTMGQVVFHNFPYTNVEYTFINRGKTQFPGGFADALHKELKALSKVKLSYKEIQWLSENWCISGDYVEFLTDFRFKPEQVSIVQSDGDLDIKIRGLWKETILWEVPLMAIISELYFKMTDKVYDEAAFVRKTENKSNKMQNAGVAWSDFGTRRRFSFAVQNKLNSVMQHYQLGFKGTSNPYFAMKYKLTPIGTYAHEAVMAMQVLHNVKDSNRKWMGYWCNEYDGYMRIALTDTLTTDVFLRDFDKEMADKFAGVRQDSGDPFEFGEKLIQHYEKLGIDPLSKKIVFSDSLDADKAVALHERFSERIQCVMGIGTHLTNDCGHKPLNMVIKLTAVEGMPVVKLSDDKGKHTGVPEVIEKIKDELGINNKLVIA
jgi:nicotinate phosphoribosyltransferase